MRYGSFYRNRTITMLIALTGILFFAFIIFARVLITNQIEGRVRDSIQFQAVESAEILEDLEDGMQLIDESYIANAKLSLRRHVNLALEMIEVERREHAKQLDHLAVEELTLQRLEAYRDHMDGSLAVFSLEEGMLLYPTENNTHMNIYFNARNRRMLDDAISKGSMYGELITSDIMGEEYALDGYFEFYREWNWLVFAVRPKETGSKYRAYGESITIHDGIARAREYDIVDAAYVMDAQYFYEFGVAPTEVGRKMSTVDVETNRNLSEIFENHMNGFVEYIVADPHIGDTQTRLAYILKSEDARHIVVVEAVTGSYKQLIDKIMMKIEGCTLIAVLTLTGVLFILYENFVTFTDPVAERGEVSFLNEKMRNIMNTYGIIMVPVLLLLVVITVKVVDIYHSNAAENILEKRVVQLEALFTSYMDAGNTLKQLNDEYVDSALKDRLEAILASSDAVETDALAHHLKHAFKTGEIRFDQVATSDYSRFMNETYGLNIEGYDTKPIFYGATADSKHYRIVSKYMESNDSVAVYAEDISEIDNKRKAYILGIEQRIEEHIDRTPKAVHVLLVSEDGRIEYSSYKDMYAEDLEMHDMVTGQRLMDMIRHADNEKFEFQSRRGMTYTSYLYLVKNSPQYGAYLVMGLEKENFASSLGANGKRFFRLIQLIMVVVFVWTLYRFKRLLRGTGLRRDRTRDEEGSIF